VNVSKVGIYKISWYPILIFMFFGFIFLLLNFWDVKGILEHLFVFISGFIFSFVLLGSSFYLWRKRIAGKGFYWDEIEDIKFYKSSVTHMKSTVIYPHYTNHEKIRIRHKKLMTTTAHSIEWYLIEKPKEMHQNLIQSWRERQK
jgi:hypothetical protein